MAFEHQVPAFFTPQRPVGVRTVSGKSAPSKSGFPTGRKVSAYFVKSFPAGRKWADFLLDNMLAYVLG
jgi:hypothetical protein